MALYLKGDRCYTDKCAIQRRNYPPGQHGQGRSKISDYGLQLREKQKVKRMYGVLEKQFRGYFEKAERMRGVTGNHLLALLERRLDNVVYRLGFANSRSQARQLVRHNHILVDGRRVNLPLYIVKVGQTIQITEKLRSAPIVRDALELVRTGENRVYHLIEEIVHTLPAQRYLHTDGHTLSEAERGDRFF